MPPATSTPAPDPAVGLCSMCQHCRRTGNTRGSFFYRCGRADDDPAFHRYPRLPVHVCPGFEAGDPPRAG